MFRAEHNIHIDLSGPVGWSVLNDRDGAKTFVNDLLGSKLILPIPGGISIQAVNFWRSCLPPPSRFSPFVKTKLHELKTSTWRAAKGYCAGTLERRVLAPGSFRLSLGIDGPAIVKADYSRRWRLGPQRRGCLLFVGLNGGLHGDIRLDSSAESLEGRQPAVILSSHTLNVRQTGRLVLFAAAVWLDGWSDRSIRTRFIVHSCGLNRENKEETSKRHYEWDGRHLAVWKSI